VLRWLLELLAQCLRSQSAPVVLVFAVACEEARLLVLNTGLLIWEVYSIAQAAMFARPWQQV
jgi:hypothetical protein